jgi:hypothetical protein
MDGCAALAPDARFGMVCQPQRRFPVCSSRSQLPLLFRVTSSFAPYRTRG